MEAAPRLPMIHFVCKTSTEKVTFAGKLKQYIASFYHEDPESYNAEIYRLEALRSAAVHPVEDITSLQRVKEYYCQLHYLKSRFPMEEGQPCAVYFSWKDVYTSAACSIPDITFEMANILHNIGALHTQFGAAEKRSTSDGMKITCTHFQCAAWAFQTLREQFPHILPLQDCVELTHAIQLVCLAQAQECILEKSMLDNRKATIIAKVAMQVVDYYKQALANMQSAKEDSETMKIDKYIFKYLAFKCEYHRAIALLYQGQQSEEQQKMGERVAFYQAALEHHEEARKYANSMANTAAAPFKEALTFTLDVIEGKRKAAKNENEFIYHEEVPSRDLLQEIKGASLVKGIPFNLNDVEVSGPDIFARLVPMQAHEASSLYSESKAELLRKMGEKIEEKDQALAEFMSSMQLDTLNQIHQCRGLPQDIIDRAAALSARSTVCQDLSAVMTKLSSSYHDVEAMLNDIQELLKEEEQKEKEYQSLMGKRPPSLVATDLSREAAKYQEAHNKAADSNQNLHRAMMAHVANIKMLAMPLSQIQQQLPSIELPNANIDEQQLQGIQKLVDKVEEMKSQRGMFWSQLREEVHKDDITAILVTKPSDMPVEEVFTKELQKHKKYCELIDQNLAAQDNILKALIDSYAQFTSARKYIQDVITKRSAFISNLIGSYDAVDDLLGKANKGIEFYNKLETNVSKLFQRIKSACKVQDEEREQILLKNNQTKPEPAAISGSRAPKLKDYLDTIKGEKKLSKVDNLPIQSWPVGARPNPVGSEFTATQSLDMHNSGQITYGSAAHGYGGYTYSAGYNQPISNTGQSTDSTKLYSQYGSNNYSQSYDYSQNSAFASTDDKCNSQGSMSYGHPSASYGQGSTSYPQGSTNYPQYSGEIPQATLDKSQGTRNYPQGSAHYLQGSLSYPQDCTNYPHLSGGTFQSSLDKSQESFKYPQGSTNYQGSTQVATNYAQIAGETSANYPQKSQAQPDQSHSTTNPQGSIHYPQGSTTYLQGSTNYSQRTTTYNQISVGTPQDKSEGPTNYPQGSTNYQSSGTAIPDRLQSSTNYPQGFTNYPQTSTSLSQESTSYPQGSTNYPNYPHTYSNYPQESINYPQTQTPSAIPHASGTNIPHVPTNYPHAANYPFPGSTSIPQGSSNYSQACSTNYAQDPTIYPQISTPKSTTNIPHSSVPNYPQGSINYPSGSANYQLGSAVIPEPSPSFPQDIEPTKNSREACIPDQSLDDILSERMAALLAKTKKTNVPAASPNTYIPGQYSQCDYSQGYAADNFYATTSMPTANYQTLSSTAYPYITTSEQTGTPSTPTATGPAFAYGGAATATDNNWDYLQTPQTTAQPNVHTNQTHSAQSFHQYQQYNNNQQANAQYYTYPQGQQYADQTMAYATQNYYNYPNYPTGSLPSTAQEAPSTQVEPKPVTSKTSHIDLLSGIDFNISQAPLVPQTQNKTIQQQPVMKTSENPIETHTSTLVTPTKTIAKVKDKKEIVVVKKKLDRPNTDPFENTETVKLFIQEVDKFEKFCDTLVTKTLNGPTNLDLKWKEIQDRQDNEVYNKSISVARCYPLKNRFADILPYDYSRVELKSTMDDYINASYVKDASPNCPTFVVTQAPIQSTFGDFWTMIWEQDIDLIICLLNNNELDSDVYWPTIIGKDLIILDKVISLVSTATKDHWVERKLTISLPEERKVKTFLHLQFTAWPGSLFPTTPVPFVNFVKETLTKCDQMDITYPIVVHCSAGIGRSGLFSVLLTSIVEVMINPSVLPDIPQISGKMSCRRRNIIRDREHLRFCYTAFLYYLKELLSRYKPDTSSGHSRKASTSSLNIPPVVDDPLSSLDPLWATKKK